MPEVLYSKTDAETPAPPATINFSHKGPRSPRRDKILDVMKTLVWVIPLTILLWVYAERETSAPPEKIIIPIGVRIGTPDKIVTLIDPADSKITATITGPRTSVDRLKDKISQRPDYPVVVRTLEPSTLAGRTQIPVSVIANDPLFTDAGISVRDISPNNLSVGVDDLVTECLPVRALKTADNLQGEMIFSPSTVKVTAPRLIFDAARAQLTGAEKLAVTADISKLDNYLKDPGTHENIPGVPISFGPPGDLHVKLDQATVSATFVVKERLNEYVVKSVPIWPGGPEGIQKSAAVTLKNGSTLTDITVVGTPAAIDALKESYDRTSDDAPIIAWVYVTSMVPDQTVIPHFMMPEGIHLKGKREDHPIDIQVSPK